MESGGLIQKDSSFHNEGREFTTYNGGKNKNRKTAKEIMYNQFVIPI